MNSYQYLFMTAFQKESVGKAITLHANMKIISYFCLNIYKPIYPL